MDGSLSTFVDRARALAPLLEANLVRTDVERRVPDETIAALREAGLFRMLQPSRFGGAEATPIEFFDVIVELAASCPSTAWVFGVVAVHAFQVALFPDEAQQTVWGKDPSALVCSSYMPVGRVKRVDGGFELSGKWGFSSGCDHSDFALLGAMVPPAIEGTAPEMRTFLVPRAEFTIVDDWFVSGLRGTGSKSVVVANAFIPEAHTHRMIDGFRGTNPGNALNSAPLYRIPFGQIFTRTVATPAIGMLRGAIQAYIELNATRSGRADGKSAAVDPAAQEAIARAMLAFDETRLVARRDVESLMVAASRGEPVSVEDRVRARFHSGAITDRMARAIDELFIECGGSAAFEAERINRFFQDVHVARAHHANNPRKTGRGLGAILLGQPSTDLFL